MNQCHDRLRAASHQTDDPRVALLHVELPLRPPRSRRRERVRPELGPGAERPSITAENDDARAEAIVEPRKIVDQFVGHRRRHRIECIRPIEGEDFDCITLFDGDRRELVHVVRFPKAPSVARPAGCHGDASIAIWSRCCSRCRRRGQTRIRNCSLAKEHTPYHNIVY